MHELNDLCGKKHLLASPPLLQRLPFSRLSGGVQRRSADRSSSRQIPALKGCDQPRVEQLKAEVAMLRREVQAETNKPEGQ